MKINIPKPVDGTLKILLIGNNPIELSSVLEKLREVRHQKIATEIAFDLNSIVERLSRFTPNFVIVDDNIGKERLAQTMSKLAGTKKTRNIPVTVLKNSNYVEATESSNIFDYLLKQNLSADRLYVTIKNALRFKKTQQILLQAFETRSGLFKRFSEKRILDLVS